MYDALATFAGFAFAFRLGRTLETALARAYHDTQGLVAYMVAFRKASSAARHVVDCIVLCVYAFVWLTLRA